MWEKFKRKTFAFVIIGAIIFTFIIVALFASQNSVLQSIGILLIYSSMAIPWVDSPFRKDDLRASEAIIGGVLLFAILLILNLQKYIG